MFACSIMVPVQNERPCLNKLLVNIMKSIIKNAIMVMKQVSNVKWADDITIHKSFNPLWT